ncbi:glycosyltransferase family 4 protein [bacterium]|nr:glycosyltransferase family 4 protein [candidate division CSSED10-310 bacterium]
MKLGCVIQRYGTDIAGGAELHCRLIAEQLTRFYSVEIFTTCAKDYVSWKNEYRAGTEIINGLPVHRYPVKRTRNMHRFFDVQNLVFHGHGTSELEELWIRENGPFSPKLLKAVSKRSDIDAWILFSYRYWTTIEVLRMFPDKSYLVPTAEHDPAIHMKIFSSIFKLPKAIIYNSPEERQLIQTVSENYDVPGDVVGVGLIEEPLPEKQDTLEVFHKHKPYIIYVGRIDKNKGCDHLFRYFIRLCKEERQDIHLLLIGKPVITIPDHPNIHHLGFVSESTKMAAILNASALIMPSLYESLSMVVLEAWRAQRPVIVNRSCEVLEGQCERSGGGLPYKGFDEFVYCVSLLADRPELGDVIGRNGHEYYVKEYSWNVIVSKYRRLLEL